MTVLGPGPGVEHCVGCHCMCVIHLLAPVLESQRVRLPHNMLGSLKMSVREYNPLH